MTARATGAQGTALELLAAMVVASNTFRAAVGADTDQGTQEHVHFPYVEDPNQTKRPFAVLEQGRLHWATVAGGRQCHMLPAGTIRMRLVADMVTLDDAGAAHVTFVNFADGVLAEIAALAGQSGRLWIQEITQTQEPVQSHPADVAKQLAQVPFYWAGYDVAWGVIR